MIKRLSHEELWDEFEDPLKNYTPRIYKDVLERTLAEETISSIQYRPFTTVSPDSPIQLALQKMVRSEITCVLVAEDQRLVGIFSERDVLNRVASDYYRMKNRPVREVMTSKPVFLYETDSLAKALCAMALYGFRHVPVLDLKENIMGIVSPQRVASFLQENIDGGSRF